ncbi:hypothetical protein BDZ97DRAFT_1930866 [Flammula alnicola]|nr:hypothetical protein BDZ97DRAFT_1930866 [Flammula alnicola]
MPPRSSRNNNARNNKPATPSTPSDKHQPMQASPPFSPPTHLPTPLPEEHIPATQHRSSRMEPPLTGLGLDLGDNDITRVDGNATLSPLIDFDTPTPPPLHTADLISDPSLDMESSMLDNEALTSTYRSPPYREALLPQESPPPLPIPPRHPQEPYDSGEIYGRDDHEVMNVSDFAGHTRSPTFPRASYTPSSGASSVVISPTHSRYNSSPSTLENLSRTIRGYVPSNVHIPIPIAAPSPPLVSRPVSFGLFSGSPAASQSRRRVVSQQEYERDYERDAEDATDYYVPPPPQQPPDTAPDEVESISRGQRFIPTTFEDVSGLGTGASIRRGAAASSVGATHGQVQRGAKAGGTSTYPRSVSSGGSRPRELPAQADTITWAKWDTLNERRVLVLAYAAGLQLWDCADLSAISEVFNLNFDSAEWALMVGDRRDGSEGVRVVHAAVLPPPSSRSVPQGGKDPFAEMRPLLGILMESVDEDEREHEPRSTFVLYSLRKHQVVKLLSLSGLASTFIPNELFVSTTTPPTLHILSSTSFHTLHIIGSTSIEAFASPLASQSSPSSAISITNAISTTAQSTLSSKSVSLAGLSIDNNSSNTSRTGNASPEASAQRQPEPHPVFALSHRLLAYASPSPSSSPSLLAVSSKASRRLSSSSTASGPSNAASSLSSSPFGLGVGLGKITNMTQADVGHAALKVGESMFSGMKFLGGMALEAAKSRVGPGPEGRVGAFVSPPLRRGDGRGAGAGGGGRFVSRSAPDTPGAGGDATQMLREGGYSNTSNVSGWDQHGGPNSSGTGSPNSPNPHLTTVAPHTKSIAENGHYITVFDLSPLLSGTQGAAPTKIDEFNASRSQPVADLQFSKDGISVAVVLRNGHSVRVFKLHPTPSVVVSARSGAIDELGGLDAHTVVEDLDWARDGRWLAVGTRNRTIHVFPVNPYGGKSDIRSHMDGRVRNVDIIYREFTDVLAPKLKRGTNYQDVLVFDPQDGILSLRRLTIEKHLVKEQGVSGGVAASVQALGVTSISLPGMGGAGRLSSSPSNKANATSSKSPTSAGIADPPMELAAKESIEATWDLKRGRDWVEMKMPVQPRQMPAADSRRGGDWLAEGEISTCSLSTRVLPRSLYLSHQFSFHTLGEDYHALIRRYQFDIPGVKIEVRKAVEISAYSSGGGESAFVESFSSPRDIRRVSSSFDEPIASAISGSFDNSNLPAILPMYPNGVPGSKSFRNSIPIRTMAGIGDGSVGAVPLEFDEEDEDFIDRDALEVPTASHGSTSRDTSRDGASAESASSLVTPSNSSTRHLMDADVMGSMEEEIWNGWDPQDKLAVEEAEQFHDIAAVGYLDEDRERRPVIVPSDVTKRKGRPKRRG